MDRIYIRDLGVRTIIGTYPGERREKQELVFNIVLGCDLSAAGASDRLEDTVNYKSVKRAIIAHVESAQYFLIEKAADAVAKICLDTPGVKYVKVTVDKPGALRFARSVAVEIERGRAD